VRDAWLDLVLGSRCATCGRPGRALCLRCDAALVARPRVAWPTPSPPGLVLPVAALDYEDAVRAVVVAHKEHGRLALARPLGRLLAAAVAEVGRLGMPADGVPGLDLVPVPSHASVVRDRGHDPLLRLVRVAAAELRRDGADVAVRRLLRVRHRPEDQAALTAQERAANLQDRFTCVPRGAGGRAAGRWLVLVDDVITTGATLREAQRALEAGGGLRVQAAATVAATRRRHVPRLPDVGQED
jgi:predicted amidophosphoribosyltransferase